MCPFRVDQSTIRGLVYIDNNSLSKFGARDEVMLDNQIKLVILYIIDIFT